MAIELSEKTELFAICSKFSRLLIDPNRSLISDTLIRRVVEKDIELDMNTEGIIVIDLKRIVTEKKELKFFT